MHALVPLAQRSSSQVDPEALAFSLWIVGGILLFLLSYLLYLVIDGWDGNRFATTVLTDCRHSESEHFGKETWITFSVEGIRQGKLLYGSYAQEWQVGTRVTVEYNIGRLSGKMNVNGVWIANEA